jgi:hypothetical protein
MRPWCGTSRTTHRQRDAAFRSRTAPRTAPRCRIGDAKAAAFLPTFARWVALDQRYARAVAALLDCASRAGR